MKAYRISTLLKLAFLLAIGARTTMLLVSSYTFDPLNNSWKPSARQKKQRRNIRPGSSFSENSYAPSKSTPSPGVQFTYDEQDIVRHHYTAFGIGTNGEQQTNDPAFVPKASLVEIQYNKKTGEVSLLDEAGVVTPEEYKRIVKAVKYANEEGADGSNGSNGNAAFEQELQSQEREEGVAVGTTLYIDPEDLDPTEIIDVEDDSSDYSSSRQETPIGYHQSESVSSSETSPSTTTAHATQTAHASHAETFDSYTIAQPATVTNPSQPTASAAGYTNVQQPQQPQQPQQHQDYQYAQQHVQTVAAVATEPTAHDYQYAQQHVQTTTAVPTEPTVEQYYQQQQQQQIGYSYDYQAYYEPTTVTEQLDNEQGVEETYYDDGTYRKSRGFGFAHRRESFTGTEYEY
mmetsp:Transcript_564/g.1163  ORF Transcript_564/g.1163 Transcript_564/m.1163 type:complete len:402 (-) Transcript_564:438-1643(-)